MARSFDLKRIAVALFAAALACSLLLTGCSQQLGLSSSSEQEESGPTSRSFMTQMNQAADGLAEKMASFSEAVARQDLVSMKVQVDAIGSAISQMSSIEAPEELADLRQKYVDACTQLDGALSSYLGLYMEIDSATTRYPFDYDTYADRIAQVQSQYDAAVQALKNADESASEM